MITSRVNLACGCVSLGNMRNCQMSSNIFFKNVLCNHLSFKKKAISGKSDGFLRHCYGIVFCLYWIPSFHHIFNFRVTRLFAPAFDGASSRIAVPCNVSNSFAILNQTICFPAGATSLFGNWRRRLAEVLRDLLSCSGGLCSATWANTEDVWVCFLI